MSREDQLVDRGGADDGAATDAGSQRKARRHGRAVALYGILTALFAASVVALAYNGYERSLDLTGGASLQQANLDPASPGYEASVKPTDVRAVGVLNDAGELGNVFLVSRPSSDAGGSVVLLPLETLSQHEGEGPVTMTAAYASGGRDGFEAEVANVVGFALTDAVVVTPNEFSEAFGRSVRLSNPDTIYVSTADGQRKIEFPAGPIDVTAEQSGRYLTAISEGESVYNRYNRNIVFWDAVKQAVDPETDATTTTAASGAVGESGASGASGGLGDVSPTTEALGLETTAPAETVGDTATSVGAVAGASGSSGTSGSSTSGDATSASGDAATRSDAASELKEILDSVLGGPLAVNEIKVEEVDVPTPTGVPIQVYRPDRAATDEALPGFVPFPASAFPGQRAAVKLLNGTRQRDAELTLADEVVIAGAEVRVVGNAARLDKTDTTVVYTGAANEEAAKAIADEIGVTAEVGDVSGADIGIVVTLGSDQL